MLWWLVTPLAVDFQPAERGGLLPAQPVGLLQWPGPTSARGLNGSLLETSTNFSYDAVIVPCGGLTKTGAPLPWVVTRLDAALNHENDSAFFLVLGRGTTHTPPPHTARLGGGQGGAGDAGGTNIDTVN